MPRIPGPILAGSSVALVCTLLFTLIAVNALRDGPLVEFDKTYALQMQAAGADQPVVRSIMIVITHSGGVAAMVVLAFLGVIWEAWRGHGKWRVAVGWALIAIGGALLNIGLKLALDRDRPPREWRDPHVSELNESFPSGHAMGGTIGIGLVGYALFLKPRNRRTKILIVLCLGAWVMSIGFSRVYLRAHWFSDVLGGFTIGLGWLALGLGFLETWRRSSLTTVT